MVSVTLEQRENSLVGLSLSCWCNPCPPQPSKGTVQGVPGITLLLTTNYFSKDSRDTLQQLLYSLNLTKNTHRKKKSYATSVKDVHVYLRKRKYPTLHLNHWSDGYVPLRTDLTKQNMSGRKWKIKKITYIYHGADTAMWWDHSSCNTPQHVDIVSARLHPFFSFLALPSFWSEAGPSENNTTSSQQRKKKERLAQTVPENN